ncbi:MAG: putative maltokinase [Friedmanniella sp.]|nr:putative maltokinase [Friedmanniella sp.]
MSVSYPVQSMTAHLTGARWFAGKGRRAELVSVTPLPWLGDPQDSPAVRFEVAEVAYGGGDPTEYYQLAVSYRPGAQDDLASAEIGRGHDPELGDYVAYDAARDPEACRVVVGALLAEREQQGPSGSFRFHLTDATGLSTDLTPQVYTGQQSNTSVMLGDVAMIKLFRRLELGRNLDIEVHDALNRAGVADVAGIFGWVEGTWIADGVTRQADLAMVVEKLAEARDGWELALSTLREGTDFAPEAEALGTALAETHHALRTSFPRSSQPGAALAATMTARLDRATAAAPALAAYRSGLESLFSALAPVTLETQRVHGDFHLGQTLHTPTGWKIIDFEGEPAKTLAERAEPDSVWRDIAGMLRSFDYAAASVPGPRSATWAAECRAAFLRGYAGGDLAASDEATLRAYEADKAAYEVVYEVRNRPDWVTIPLGAIAGLAAAGGASPADEHHTAGTKTPSSPAHHETDQHQVKE